MPDAVVIGAGQNGLVAGNLLADKGWSVLVLEGSDECGGAVRSGELIEPGFVNDRFSAFYPLAAASPVFGPMHLDQHGLTWCRAPLVLAHPSPLGTCPIVSPDLDETCESLDKDVVGDGDGWRHLYDLFTTTRDGLLGLLMSPFPPVKGPLKLATSLPPAKLVRFARLATMPVRRVGEEEFGGDSGRRLIAGNALHADFAPESAISGMFGLVLLGLAQWVGFPVPQGGAGSLIKALVSRLESRGGRIELNREVTEVIVRGGRAVGVRLADGTEIDAGRAVIADVAAPNLLGRLVAPEHLPRHSVEDMRRFHWDNATFKVDWTLDAPIPWEHEPARRSGTVHIADDLDALTMGAAQLAAGRVPDRPFLLVGQYSMTDPSRQPAGQETAWAYTHVPQVVRGDAGGDGITGTWDEADTEAFVRRVENEIERMAPGFKRLIRGRYVQTPVTIEAANPNLVGGAVNGGTAQLHQQFVFRPTPGLGRASTPIKGLYLGSASAHPGGGVHGVPGSNAAKAALLGDRLHRARRLFPV